MNPSTGTLITMDEYAGSVFEPVSLHKYLYANANPVFSDPSGYNSLADVETSNAGMAIVSEAYSSACMTAARAGARILALLRTSITISVMTAPFFFPLASALGDICGGLLDGTGSSASIGAGIIGNIIDDAMSDVKDAESEQDVVAEDDRRREPTFIYRWCSGTYTNFTPRPGKDNTGLSYSLSPPSDGSKYTYTTIEAINSTGYLFAVQDGPNHVSVNPTDISKMQDWMESRKNAETSPHPYKKKKKK